MPSFVKARVLEHAGLRHGFSLRSGGVSEAPFDSLNLARTVGDAPEAVAENHRRLAREVGYAPERLYEVSQVHGAGVVCVDGTEPVEEVRARQADALVTRASGAAVAVRVADCLPVLLADPDAGVVAAAHAGWRGVEAGVLAASLEHMRSLGAQPARVRAALGPHIGPCCFEVGTEVAERIAQAACDSNVIVPREPRPHVDLAAAVRRQLARLGVSSEILETVEGCTRCDAERFFSYRRDAARSGRMLAVIALS